MTKYPHGLTLQAVCDAIDTYREQEDVLPEAGMLEAFEILLAASGIVQRAEAAEAELREKSVDLECGMQLIKRLERQVLDYQAKLAELGKQEPIYQLMDGNSWYDAEAHIYHEIVTQGYDGRIVYHRPAPAINIEETK